MNTINSLSLSGQYQTRYGTKSISSVKSYNEVLSPDVREVNAKYGKSAVKKSWLDLKYGLKKDTGKGSLTESILKSSSDYGESIRNQRQQSKTTAAKSKKLKYHFKSISSKILKSKTSMAAKQAAGQARREVMRLTGERQKGNYDPDELELAISHAKAIERVAKKKVKHLLQEELSKATMGFEISSIDNDTDNEELNDAGEVEDEISGESDINNSQDESSEIMNNMQDDSMELMNDMFDELENGMEELLKELEEMELTEDILGNPLDMDEDDLKKMIIKHRNSEMKDIVKADSDYLKGLFENYQAEKDAGGIYDVAATGSMPSIDISV